MTGKKHSIMQLPSDINVMLIKMKKKEKKKVNLKRRKFSRKSRKMTVSKMKRVHRKILNSSFDRSFISTFYLSPLADHIYSHVFIY
jgi:hypothetical protein